MISSLNFNGDYYLSRTYILNKEAYIFYFIDYASKIRANKNWMMRLYYYLYWIIRLYNYLCTSCIFL